MMYRCPSLKYERFLRTDTIFSYLQLHLFLPLFRGTSGTLDSISGFLVYQTLGVYWSLCLDES
jgi:hypothetical protein